ncbi:MAG: PD-(D/E)XK nuclease family protein [Clostridia bacterium]|nr:PD-(D/E)XK nuclease family protein [Clostridia bacterium]
MEIILGRAKTGKSSYLFEKIRQDISSNKKPILFVPSQARAKTELEYIEYIKSNGIIGVDITTITEYIATILKSNNIHFDENYLSKLDKKIILTQVINENDGIFRVFKKVKNKEGFLDFLNIYMDLFRRENLDIEKVYHLDIKEKNVENKLKELTKIYEKYCEKIKEKYVDNVDEIDYIIPYMKENKNHFEDVTIYFDGYNNFSAIELQLIQTLVILDVPIAITLTTDITKVEDIYSHETSDIFEVANKTYLKLLKAANDAHGFVKNTILSTNYSKAKEEITYLAENIFHTNSVPYNKKQDSIYMTVHTNVYKEIENVAYEICKSVRNGEKYSDNIIYTTDIENYANIIARIFYEYKIPVYVDSKKGIESSKLTKYIVGLLKMASEGMTLTDVIDILKLGLNNVKDIDIYYFENYILEFKINNYNIQKEYYINNIKKSDVIYDLERINAFRREILTIFNVSELAKEKDVTSIVKALYHHLQDNGIFEKYVSSIDEIGDVSYYIYSSSVEKQVWDKLCEIFDSMRKIYVNERIDIKNFLVIFKLIMKDCYLKTIPPTLDKVLIADINTARVEMKNNVYCIGVYENAFPKRNEQDVFFNDFEIEKLKLSDIEFKETTLSKDNMALYNIYIAISNAKNQLYLSMPATDIAGNTTRKSNIMNQVTKVMNVRLLGDVTTQDTLEMLYDDIYSEEKNFEYFIKLLKEFDENNIEETSKILGIYDYYVKSPIYGDIMNYLKDDSNLKQETIKKIYGDEIKSSVTRLELFKKCPFSYYMKYVLNVKPTNDAEINVLDTGSFMHSVLEEFSYYLVTNHLSWHEILKDEESLQEEYENDLYAIIKRELIKAFKTKKESVRFTIYQQKLVNTMKKVMIVIARGFNQSEFVPFGYEMKFGDGGIFMPIEIKLENGRYMKLTGKIDRVDVLQLENTMYARIIDYKSSKRGLNLDDIKEGLSLQLITYLTAFMENEVNVQGKTVKPAGMLYFNLSNHLVNLASYTDDENTIKKEVIKNLRMNGIFLKDVAILEKMDKKVNEADQKLIDILPSRINNTNKALDEQEFDCLCKEAKGILKNIGNEIMSGVVKIKPNRKANHCEYCEYANVCRKNLDV